MANVDLINGQIDSSLRKFAVPLAVSFLVQNLYTWVDMYYVSRLNAESIAAIRASEQLIFILFAIASGFAIGSSIIIARRIGEGNRVRANESATQSTVLIVVVSVLVTSLFDLLIRPILNLMNIDSAISDLIINYFDGVKYGIPATFLIFHLNSIVRATGNSSFPLIVLIIANLINAIIAPFLIFGWGPFPRFEMFGAGISTTIAQYLGLIIALIGILKNYVDIKFNFKQYRPDWQLFGNIIKLGFPASLQIISISVNRMLMLTLTNTFGTIVLTTYMFGVGVDLLVFMSIFALGAAIEIITGQNLGANKIDRIFDYHKSAIKQITRLLVLITILVFVFGANFVSIFVNEERLINEIEIYLRIASIAYIPFAIGIFSLRVISGSGNYYRSFRIVAFIFFGIQLPCAYLLSNYTGLGHYGIWVAILVSHLAFAVLALYSMLNRKWIRTQV